ncbi:uncharacterized protein LOC117301548 [Asterias rubens]|uniref:Arnp15b n=1 Tax=Asterias rubens TaxID=7604 RepID=A0A0U2PG54_ASTRU|nr:uncharacterized protein LOC117301548 [Asterias rubens]ALJ99978.1 Arnp15b [Asterias rubens]
MSASTITTLLLSLAALSVFLPNASAEWSPDNDNNNDHKRAQMSAHDWLNSLLAGNDVGHAKTKRIAKACAIDCLNCGMMFQVQAYSQGDCLTACQNDDNHRDPSCHEHITM